MRQRLVLGCLYGRKPVYWSQFSNAAVGLLEQGVEEMEGAVSRALSPRGSLGIPQPPRAAPQKPRPHAPRGAVSALGSCSAQ